MEDENFLEITTSTEREEDTMAMISFLNKKSRIHFTIQSVSASFTILAWRTHRRREGCPGTQEGNCRQLRGSPPQHCNIESQCYICRGHFTLQSALAPQEVSGPLQGSLHL